MRKGISRLWVNLASRAVFHCVMDRDDVIRAFSLTRVKCVLDICLCKNTILTLDNIYTDAKYQLSLPNLLVNTNVTNDRF